MRPRISPAALLVKVTARMPCGDAFSTCTSQRDAMRQHARLAAAGAGKHQRRRQRRGHGSALRVVQSGKNR